MSKTIELLEQRQLRKGRPRFKAGDTVRVHFQVIEGQRRRIQVFEGIVIKRQGAGVRETFTVRKQSFGVGVERTFPLHSPKIEKIEVMQIGDVNRAKLYYLREKVGKKARVRAVQRRDRLCSPDVVEEADDEPDGHRGRRRRGWVCRRRIRRRRRRAEAAVESEVAVEELPEEPVAEAGDSGGDADGEAAAPAGPEAREETS